MKYNPSTWRDQLFFALIFIILLLGVTTNSYLAFNFCSKKTDRMKNILVINLSVLNIIASLSYGAVLKRIYYQENLIENRGSDPWCVLEGGLMAYCSLSAILQLAFVSAERAITIFYRALKIGHKILACILVYCLTVCLVAPPLFGWGEIKESKNRFLCCFDFLNRSTSNRAFILYIFILGYFVPCTVIVASYGLIWCKLRSKKRLRLGNLLKNRLKKEELHISRLMFVASVAFNLSWAYFAILALIGQFGDQSLLNAAHVTTASLLAKSFVLNNALIYGFMDPAFRKRMGKFFCGDDIRPQNERIPLQYRPKLEEKQNEPHNAEYLIP